MTTSSRPVLLSETPNCLRVQILDKTFKLSPVSWACIENRNFYYPPKNKSQRYPSANDSRTNTTRTLPTILFNARCYTVSKDVKDLRITNLMETSIVENLEPGLIRVHIGNGKSFLTDEKYTDLALAHKWSLIELKPGYPYVARRNNHEAIQLFHRIVAGATEPDQHVDHLDWDTLNNTGLNLEIKSLYENISRRNPNK